MKMHVTVLVLVVLMGALVGCVEERPITPAQREAIALNIQSFSVVNDGQGTTMVVDTVKVDPGASKYTVCSACHGQQGGGGIGPTLAGKGVDYVVDRLIAYRSGEQVGPQSNQMWGQAANLSDSDINDLANYINSF